MSYFVYILRSLKDNSYYVGTTSRLRERIKDHNSGKSKSTSSKKPFELVYSEEFASISQAYIREKYIKSRKKRNYIEKLIAQW
jgi:putative endonuclease